MLIFYDSTQEASSFTILNRVECFPTCGGNYQEIPSIKITTCGHCDSPDQIISPMSQVGRIMDQLPVLLLLYLVDLNKNFYFGFDLMIESRRHIVALSTIIIIK